MNKRITELDGVRAIAVALVFLNHFAPIESLPWMDLPRRLGWIGVDVFFVLSGFLVTGILLEANGRTGFYRNFYARRSLRIFPLYYAVLTASLLYMLARKDGYEFREMLADWGNPVWLYAYLGNIKTAVTNVSPPSYFVPMWSLHVEEQYYLIFPLLVRRLTRVQLTRLLIAAIAIAPLFRLGLLWQYPSLTLLQYMLFPCRMDAIALGALVAIYRPDRSAVARKLPLLLGGLTLLTTAILTFELAGGSFDSAVERTIGYSLFDFAFVALLVLVLACRDSAATAWLNTRPIQFVGMISYGLYLFQEPAATLASKGFVFLGIPSVALRDTVLGFVIAGATCLSLATVSWYLWETKWLLLKDRFVGQQAAHRSRNRPCEAVQQA